MFLPSNVWMRRASAAVAVLALASNATSAPLASTVRMINDVTDFSPTGLDLGKAGYWFPNFDAPAPARLVDVDQDVVDAMPPWLVFDYDPGSATYSFGLDSPSTTYSTGGISTYNNFTLPNGVTGLSGQLVDDMNTSGTRTRSFRCCPLARARRPGPSSASFSTTLPSRS